jgi:hypothetical protein
MHSNANNYISVFVLLGVIHALESANSRNDLWAVQVCLSCALCQERRHLA